MFSSQANIAENVEDVRKILIIIANGLIMILEKRITKHFS